ncbi:class I SAM-dependent methyltransferase [Myxococcaceae bacterium GXIMD 01537]
MSVVAHEVDSEARARLSHGRSEAAVHRRVADLLRAANPRPGRLYDVGCGTGTLAETLRPWFTEYVGVDIARYPGFPEAPWARFVQADLNAAPYPLPEGEADVVVSVETVEHLENPRALLRELRRLLRPGGLLIVTTPNQLSLLSKLTLVLRNEFNAFQDAPGLYPSHITALLEVDLRRMAAECGFRDIQVEYTHSGRIPGTAHHWPARLGLRGRLFSDNILLRAVR